jgi:hypothetical protein
LDLLDEIAWDAGESPITQQNASRHSIRSFFFARG